VDDTRLAGQNDAKSAVVIERMTTLAN
jgi:hypothetical protein